MRFVLAGLAALCVWALAQPEAPAQDGGGCAGAVQAAESCAGAPAATADATATSARATLWQRSADRRADRQARRADRQADRAERWQARRGCGG